MAYGIRELPYLLNFRFTRLNIKWSLDQDCGSGQDVEGNDLFCSQVEAKATEENCDGSHQIATSISCLVSGVLCALSNSM
jgi:hypothetical protein